MSKEEIRKIARQLAEQGLEPGDIDWGEEDLPTSQRVQQPGLQLPALGTNRPLREYFVKISEFSRTGERTSLFHVTAESSYQALLLVGDRTVWPSIVVMTVAEEEDKYIPLGWPPQVRGVASLASDDEILRAIEASADFVDGDEDLLAISQEECIVGIGTSRILATQEWDRAYHWGEGEEEPEEIDLEHTNMKTDNLFEALQTVELTVTGKSGTEVELSLPGLKPIRTDLKRVRDWVEDNFGKGSEVSPLHSITLVVDVGLLFDFLSGPGVDVNDYLLEPAPAGRIAASEDLYLYFSSLNAVKAGEAEPEEEEPLERAGRIVPTSSDGYNDLQLQEDEEGGWVVHSLDGSYVSPEVTKWEAGKIRQRLESEGVQVRMFKQGTQNVS